MSKLPSRAFDSPAQYAETAALAADYNAKGQNLSPDVDARFARLAEQRIAAHPLRYYVWLPLGGWRICGCVRGWRTCPSTWTGGFTSHHRRETPLQLGLCGVERTLLLLGFAGLCLRPRYWPWMLAYLVLRSALLTTVEAPEARYTLECFPMLFACGGIAVAASLGQDCGEIWKDAMDGLEHFSDGVEGETLLRD